MRFGVPEFKIEKRLVERRLAQLAAEGVELRYGVDVGVDIERGRAPRVYDAVVVATGSRVPRDLPSPGRELDGVHFAMEYLYERARAIAAEVGTAGPLAPAPAEQPLTAAGKHVIVIGGGDTGADCVANALRENAASVTQIEVLGEPPAKRPDDLTPWPRWPMKLRTSYALKEGGERDFAISTTHLSGSGGKVEQIHWAQNDGTPAVRADPGDRGVAPGRARPPGDGVPPPGAGPAGELGVERDGRGNAEAPAYATSVDGVFAAGDARRGQSLVVWAINEGRQCAAAVDPGWLPKPGRPAEAGHRRPQAPRNRRAAGFPVSSTCG